MGRPTVTRENAPDALVRKLDVQAAKVAATGWYVELRFEPSANSRMFGSVVARKRRDVHIHETVVLTWSITANNRYSSPMRFEQAWRGLFAPKGVDNQQAESGYVSAERKFFTIGEAMDYLRSHAPREASDRYQPSDGGRATLSASQQTTNQGEKTVPTKSAAKKVPAKKVPAKKAAAAKKAPATKKVAPDSAARIAEREAVKEAQRTQVVKLRDKDDLSWADISTKMSLDMNLCNIRYLEATEYAKPSTPTPAAVKKAREVEKLSWVQIMAKFRFATKTAAQKMYEEAGGDLAFQVGRGGRFIEHAEKAPAAKKATKAAAAKKAAATKSVFNGDESAEDIKSKIDGKKITVKPLTNGGAVRTFTVGGTIKVGKDKSGTRVVQFSDDGQTNTVAIGAIVKVGR